MGVRDGRALRQAVVSATAALSACAALALPALPAAAARPATAAPAHRAVQSAARIPATTAARPAKPKPPPGRRIQGDIVPGHAPAAPAIRHDAERRTHVTKVLVILGYWSSHDSTTPAKAKQIVITQSNAWYRRASYGLQGLTGTATKWLRIPQQKCGALNDAVIKAARKAADQAHYHSAGYDRIVLYEPCTANGFIGVGNLPGSNVVLVKGGLNLPTAVHEEGHNFGLGHANQLLCTRHGGRATYQPGASCKTLVYDDFSSSMSSEWNAKIAPDFTAPQKDKLGWLAGHVRTVSASASNVTLNPYESTSGTHAIKIPGSSGRTYWVEYRTTSGNDAHLPKAYRGVLIHMSRPDTTPTGKAARLSQSLLLHTLAPDPTVLGFDANAGPAYLPQLSSWTTPDGIRITLTAESPGSAKITVARGANAHAPGAVQNVDATALDASAAVSFPRAADNGLPIRSYTVTAHSSGGSNPSKTFSDFTGASTLHATITGLTNDKDYTFSVKATNESGSGASATTASSVIPTELPPMAVITSPTGGDVHGVVDVNAHGVRNSVTNAKITELELRVDGHSIGDVAASSQTFHWDTGAAPGFAQDASHTIKVIATDANGRQGMTTVSVNLTQSTGPQLTLGDITAGAHAFQVDINGTLETNGGSASHALDALTVRIGNNEDDFNSPGVGPYTDTWDTTGLLGSQTINITARDHAGRVSVISKTVPLTNPGVSFQDPTGSVFGNVHFTGTVTNNSPVDGVTVDVQRNGSMVKTKEIDVDSGQNAPFDIVVNVDELASGSGSFALKATDGTKRNVSTPTRNLTVTRKIPDVTLTAPAASSVVHDTVHFTGTATNNSGTDGLNIVIKQGATTIVMPTDLDIDAGATGPFDVSADLGALGDATTSFDVTVADNKTPTPGSKLVSRSLVVSHLPEITLDTPLADTQVFGKAHFTGTLKNHSATANLTVAISTPGGTITPASQIVTVPAHSTATNFDIAVDVDGVPEGAEQMFTITVTDHDSLVNTLNQQLEVIHPIPEITVDTPLPNAVIHDTTDFTGSATNNSGTDGLTLTITVDDAPFTTAPIDVDAGATASFDVSADVSALAVGSRVFKFTVSDINGLTSDEDSRQLDVDHPPVVTVTAPAANDQVSGIVTVTGTVSNGAPDAGNPTVTATVDASHHAQDTPTVAQGATGNYTIHLDLSDLTGTKTITVSATDFSNVTTTMPITVQVTVVAPAELSVTAPAGGETVTTGSLHFAGTVTNHAATTQSMTINITDGDTIDESFQVSVPTGPAANWMTTTDIDVSGLDDGSATVHVTASYSVGGTSTEIQRMVTIDNP